MKRITAFLLCLLLLAGCSNSGPKIPGNFYYKRAETTYGTSNGVIAPEVREIDGLISDLSVLLSVYFAGPENKELESPFPKNTTVENWELKGTTLILTLSREFASLSGLDLTVACACITQTMLELTPAQTVVIETKHSPMDTNISVTMSAETLLLIDDSMDKLHTSLNVYYADKNWYYLIGQEISVNLAEEDDLFNYLIDQLSSPPSGSGLKSAIPRNTKLLDSTVENGLCTLNFSSEFISNAENSAESQRLTLLSIVNTLTQLENIQQVEISVEGDLLAQYLQLTIAGPLVADESAIGPVQTGANEFDATLYLSNGQAGSLVGVHTRIRQNASTTQAEQVVKSLLEYQKVNGFYTTIPDGTELVSIAVSGTICRIRLSSEFLSATDHVPTSVRSIVTSVCALEGLQQVQVTVEGYISGSGLDEYFQFLSSDSELFQ